MEPDRSDRITYARPAEEQHEPLMAMARRSFAEAFGHLYDADPFQQFLDRAYGPEGRMAHDLRDPTINWLVGFDEKTQPTAYAKLTP